MVFNALHEACYISLQHNIVLEKNRVILSRVNRIGSLKDIQIYSDRGGKTYTELFQELDPAITKFIELSS